MLQLLATIGEETLNTPVYVQVEPGRCHVMTECLMRYALIGQPANATCNAVKLLQEAVFVSGVATATIYNMRVYFVDDTADAFEVSTQAIGLLLSDFGWAYSCHWTVRHYLELEFVRARKRVGIVNSASVFELCQLKGRYG